MADETPPLDDERLAEIRARATASWQMLENSNTISVEVALTRDALTLLAEVDRQRAREAAAMAIVREVADVDMYYTEQPDQWNCPFCDGDLPVSEMTFNPDEARKRFKHAPDCPVTKARARLAQE